MWTHPLSTYRVDRCCESCAVKRATTDRAIEEIREKIQFTRELLAKIQEASRGLEGRSRGSEGDGESVEGGSISSSPTTPGGGIVSEQRTIVFDDEMEGDEEDVAEAEIMDPIDPNELIKVSQANFRSMIDFAREYASALEVL